MKKRVEVTFFVICVCAGNWPATLWAMSCTNALARSIRSSRITPIEAVMKLTEHQLMLSQFDLRLIRAGLATESSNGLCSASSTFNLLYAMEYAMGRNVDRFRDPVAVIKELRGIYQRQHGDDLAQGAFLRDLALTIDQYMKNHRMPCTVESSAIKERNFFLQDFKSQQRGLFIVGLLTTSTGRVLGRGMQNNSHSILKLGKAADDSYMLVLDPADATQIRQPSISPISWNAGDGSVKRHSVRVNLYPEALIQNPDKAGRIEEYLIVTCN